VKMNVRNPWHSFERWVKSTEKRKTENKSNSRAALASHNNREDYSVHVGWVFKKNRNELKRKEANQM